MIMLKFNLLATMLALLPSFHAAPGQGPCPARTWFGTLQKLELRALAPTDRVLKDQAAFARLWQAWKPADLVPTIDFANNLILVETHGTRKIDRFHLHLSPDGDLTVKVGFSDHKDFPGFTFGMAQLSKKGILRVH